MEPIVIQFTCGQILIESALHSYLGCPHMYTWMRAKWGEVMYTFHHFVVRNHRDSTDPKCTFLIFAHSDNHAK